MGQPKWDTRQNWAWDSVYWVTKNEGTGMALKTMGP